METMRMDGMQMVNMLYMMHRQQTVSPGCEWHCELEMNDKILEGIKGISSSNEVFEKFVMDAYRKYKEDFSDNALGSVDVSPKFWVQNFCLHMCNSNGKITNGCCSKDDCPINSLYRICHSMLNTK